jgi:PQQ-dependent catabolism-associated CXXCW motif protein
VLCGAAYPKSPTPIRSRAGSIIVCVALTLALLVGAAQPLRAAVGNAGNATAPAAAPHPDVPPAPKEAPAGPVEEPADYRMDNFRTTVPATLRGARVLTNDEAADLWNKDGAVFIDVYPQAPKPPNLPAGTFWREPAHRSIEGAHWLPNVGYGALNSTVDASFRASLDKLAKGKRDAPLVFFCLKDCWMSWNAAKRALEYGYTNVMWFRDGTDGWQELGYPLTEVKKME